jgi:hypothetical protein
MRFFFAVSPERRALASISLSGHAFEGAVGHIRLDAHWTSTFMQLPIDSNFGAPTVDFTFPSPRPPQPSEIVMGLMAGIEVLTFTASFRSRATSDRPRLPGRAVPLIYAQLRNAR